VPHIDYDHAIVGSRTSVRYALRLLAGRGMLKLFVVGGEELVGVSLPPEQNDFPGCLDVCATYPLTTTGMMPLRKV
jgi:hypothetical protein